MFKNADSVDNLGNLVIKLNNWKLFCRQILVNGKIKYIASILLMNYINDSSY